MTGTGHYSSEAQKAHAEGAQNALFYVVSRHYEANEDAAYAGAEESAAMPWDAAQAHWQALVTDEEKARMLPRDYDTEHTLDVLLCWTWGDSCTSYAVSQGIYGDACAACLAAAIQGAEAPSVADSEPAPVETAPAPFSARTWEEIEEAERAQYGDFTLAPLYSPEGEPLAPHGGMLFGVPYSSPTGAHAVGMPALLPVSALDASLSTPKGARVSSLIADWLADPVYTGVITGEDGCYRPRRGAENARYARTSSPSL